MAVRRKTAFDRYFVRRMKETRFATEYGAARAEIDATDALVRALDQVREVRGLSKAELARRVGVKPEIIRRLLTDPKGNPTIATILAVASVMGCRLELVRDSNTRGGRKLAPRHVAARKLAKR